MPQLTYRSLESRLPDRTAERSAHLKAEIYDHGIRISQDAIDRGIGSEYKENQYGYDNPNDEVNTLFPSEITLPDNGKTQGKRGIVVAFRHRKSSPFVLKSSSPDEFELHFEHDQGSEVISKADIPPRPHFWDRSTENEIPMKRIGNIYGTDCYNVCVRNQCQFWGTKSQCKFCSMNTTHDVYDSPVEIQKQIDDIAEIAEEAFSNNHARVGTFTGGSFWNHNKEARFYIDMLNEIGDRLGRDRLRNFVLITMPPLDFDLIDELYATGLEFLDFNMEAYSQQAFDTMLPGKSKYGREKFLDALSYAADVFGEGKAWTNLIIPLEDIEDIKRGFEELCAMGVNPGGNVFHPDMNSQLYHKETPSSETIREVFNHGADLLQDYGYKPFLTDNTMRGSLMWEAYYGWL